MFLNCLLVLLQHPLLLLQHFGEYPHHIHGAHPPAVLGSHEGWNILGDKTYVFIILIRFVSVLDRIERL